MANDASVVLHPEVDAIEQGWIRTYSGRRIKPLHPDPKDIRIEDIAHALSYNNRFTGHTRWAYTVAQHSLIASFFVHREAALWALLHDASEAYLSDIASPIKRRPEFLFYRVIEERLLEVIAEKFGLSKTEPVAVKHVDKRLLCTEQAFLTRSPRPYPAIPLPEWARLFMLPWPAVLVKYAFLWRFHWLRKRTVFIQSDRYNESGIQESQESQEARRENTQMEILQTSPLSPTGQESSVLRGAI